MTNNDTPTRSHVSLQMNETNTDTSLFKLAQPLKCFHAPTTLITFSSTPPTSNLVETFVARQTSNLNLFDFNAPYQAYQLKDLTRSRRRFRSNLTPISQSAYSFTNSKQQEINLKENSNRTYSYLRTSNTNIPTTQNLILESDSTQSNTTYNSSNAILAKLKSISPYFKSIFVRPKTHKPIGNFF